MARNMDRIDGRDEEPNTSQLRAGMASGRTPSKTSAEEPSAAPFDTDDEAAGRPADSSAVKQALAEEKLRRVHAISTHARRGAVGPLGSAALLIGLLALAGLFMAWLLLMA